MKNKIIAVIPARGGSKGIPHKNIIPVSGKPLICYTIDSALKSTLVNRVIVSTDDEEIAKIAKDSGAELPFLRPAELAKDDTSSLHVVQHAVKFIEDTEGCVIDLAVLLQPTSPMRSEKYIDACIEKALTTNADSVITVCKVKHHPYWSYVSKNDRLYPLINTDSRPVRRQDFPTTYTPNGAVYVVRRDVLFNQNSIFGTDLRGIVMPTEESVDVDDYFDWFIAEMTLKYWRRWFDEKSKDWK
jgi:CMP-N-acetylneuraminic acid synthetase